MLKESLYNVAKEYDEKQWWVYNTLTTSLVFIEDEKYKRIFIDWDIDEDDNDVKALYEMGFLIDNDYDEREYLRSLREDVVNSTHRIANMMIAPTMDCNARCYYCFEHGCHHEKMTFSTADAIVDYIAANWNHDLFSVTWFGGEPLLASDVISYFSKKLYDKNIKFISKIVTNGSLLTDEIIKNAKGFWNTIKIQVSIDAEQDEYNRIKNYKNGVADNPYELVINNVKKALEAGIKIRIRVNFNPLEQEKAKSLMSTLEEMFGSFDNYDCYFAPIDAPSKVVPPIAGTFKDEKMHPWLSLIRFSQKYGYFLGNNRGESGNFLGDSEGILANLKIYPCPTNCYASCPHVFAVDSKGDIYKCHRVLGQGKQYCSGNIKTGIIKNDIYNFFSDTSLALKECENCKLLPICQGGCKINAYMYKDNHACCPAKSVLPELVEEYIRQTKERGLL